MKVVHLNKSKIKDEKNDTFKKWVEELVKESISRDIKKEEKRTGLDLTELRIKYNVF